MSSFYTAISALFCHYVVLFSLFNAFEASKCIEGGKVAFSFEGGPNPSTPALLEILRKQNSTALFNIDPEKLTDPSNALIIKNIASAGHIVGLSLGVKFSESWHGSDYLPGLLERYLKEVEALVGSQPLFIHVAKKADPKIVQQIQELGFILVTPQIDLSEERSGMCVPTFEASLPISGDNQSFIVSLSDTGFGCHVRENEKIVALASTKNYSVSRIDHCINLGSPYRRKSSNNPVTFSLFEQPTSSSIKPSGLNYVNASGVAAPKTSPLMSLVGISILVLLAILS